MANKPITLKRNNSGTVDNLYPKTTWDQIETNTIPDDFNPSSHTHGLISNAGKITSNTAIASGDRLVFSNYSDGGTLVNSSITFGTGTTTFLRNDGTWGTPAGVDNYVNISGDTMTGGLNLPSYAIDTDFYHTWTKKYVVNTTTPATLLYKDGNALPNGGVYRFTAHIAGTGTDNMSQAVFWNRNGTWKVNVTGQAGTSSNHPEFVVSGGVPKLTTDHSSNYTISVFCERMELEEGTGTDNAQFAFGAGSFLGSVNGVLRYNSGGGSDYTAGSTVWHSGNDGSGSGLDADTLDTKHASDFWQKSGSWAGDLTSNGYTREIGLQMTGGSEFAVLSKSGQGSVLVDGQYLSYESNNGFFGSFNSQYGNLTGIQATAANTLTVKQLDNGDADLVVTGDVGIGTTSPSSKLQVNGNLLLGSSYVTPSGSSWNTSNAQLILGGAHNAEFNNGSAVKLLITGHNNDSPTDMYPIFVEDENGLDDFWLKARASAASGATMYLDGSFGIGTTSPETKLDVSGGIIRNNTRVDGSEKFPLGHYTSGETVFEIDPTWSQDELRAYFNNSSVSWQADSTAPGGYAIKIDGGRSFGGQYGSGFPYIPVDQDDEFYMEMWIRSETNSSNAHYIGSNEYNESFTSLGGNPGSFGYWVMSGTSIGDTWTKVSGYIGGFSNSTGDFETGTKYWTPLMLANYTNVSGSRISYISGWKVIKVSQPGNRFFKDDVFIDGDVGIGTTNPKTKLNVASGTSAAVTPTLGSAENSSAIFTNSVNSYGLNVMPSGSGDVHLQVQRFDASTSVYDLNLQPSGGNVGIGTTSPSQKLDVSGNIRTSSSLIAGGNLYLNDDNTAGNSYVFFGDAASDSAHYLQFSDATQKFTLTDDLIVTGDVTVNGSFTMVDTNTSTTEQWSVTNDGTGPAVIINQTGAQPIMDVQDDGTSAFYIADGGKVGIGTTTPLTTGGAHLLTLYASGARGMIMGASNDDALYIRRVNAVGEYQLQTKNASGNGGEIHLQPYGGNVGIGTTSPSEKLEVAGNINADELHLNDTNTKLLEGSSNSVRIQTSSGWIDVGPRNTSWSHFYTDRPRFYFGTGIDVDGDIRPYSNNTTKIQESTGYIFELGNRVLTTASEGSGNGLDADLLDGNHASAFAASSHNHSASEIVTGEMNTARLGSGTATSGYVLKSDGDGTASWQADSNTTYSTATSSTLGLVKIGYTESGQNYPVELSNGQMYVNVPWTDNNTTYSAAGTGLSLSGTTFQHGNTSSQASVNNSGRTYIQDITLDDFGHITGITSATETVVDTNTVTQIRKDNTGTYRTGNINLVGGAGVTITETASGVFSFAASGSGSGITGDDTEWAYVGKSTDSQTGSSITVNSTDLGESYDWANYDYKFVYQGSTTAEDTSQPYIRFDGVTTNDKYSYQYVRWQQTAETTETQTVVGDAKSNLIYTGLALASYSAGGYGTDLEIEFTVRRSGTTGSGFYGFLVRGEGNVHYWPTTQNISLSYDGMAQTRFVGSFKQDSAITSMTITHSITAGGTDTNIVRVYKRRRT